MVKNKTIIKAKKLGKKQKKALALLYKGPIHVRYDGGRSQWQRQDAPDANIAAIHGFSEYHIYPYSSFIEDFAPMIERVVVGDYVEIPVVERSQLRHIIYALWERGLIVVFTRKVEKMKTGYRRAPHVFERFKTNRGRSGKIFGLTLSTEGLLLCRKLFDEEKIEDNAVIFE